MINKRAQLNHKLQQMENGLNKKMTEVELRMQTTINEATKNQLQALMVVREERAAIPHLQEKQCDVQVAMEASVHELIVQNVEEVEEEQQLEPESDRITMDETHKIPILMRARGIHFSL